MRDDFPVDTFARIAAIRAEIAEHGHHPGPDNLADQDFLVLCDEVERLLDIEQAAVRLIEHGPNTGHTYAEFMVYVERLTDTIRSA